MTFPVRRNLNFIKLDKGTLPDDPPCSEITTKVEMDEIRNALLAVQEKEDAETEKRFFRQQSPAKSVDTTATSVSMGDQGDEKVALYSEGATSLFRSIEQCDWEQATHTLRRYPEQAEVWVVSTGTVNTTFDWSRWKRLPLHEGARRQAPVQFMTELIRAYPSAVYQVTQFGELPLHSAVECGACPSVVNLLAVWNWKGCHATDQSGRTPLDILEEAELLDPQEQHACFHALTATSDAWNEICDAQASGLDALRKQHAAGLKAVRKQHDRDLALEQDQQDKLLREVATLKQQLAQQKQVIAHQESGLQQLQKTEAALQSRVESLERGNITWKKACEEEQTTVAALQETISVKDAQAVVLADRIVDLQTVVTRLADYHKTVVRSKLNAVERKFQTAFSDWKDFTETMTDHSDDLQTLLQEMDGHDDDTDTTHAGSTNATSCRGSDDPTIASLVARSSSSGEDSIASEDAILQAARAASSML